jgi:hypothetical protein
MTESQQLDLSRGHEIEIARKKGHAEESEHYLNCLIDTRLLVSHIHGL